MIKKNILSFTSSLLIGLSYSVSAHTLDQNETTKSQDNLSGASQTHTTSQVHDFITEIGNEIIEVLAQKDKSIVERKKIFNEILLKYFNMPAIGEFVIGQYWKQLNDTQRKEYIDLFEQAVTENYAAKFNNYNNQRLEVKNVIHENHSKHFRVYSNIVQPSGKIFHKIEWIIQEAKDGLRVLDIRIEGISMRLTMRTDYTGVYRRGGYSELKQYLNNKINDAAEQSLTD